MDERKKATPVRKWESLVSSTLHGVKDFLSFTGVYTQNNKTSVECVFTCCGGDETPTKQQDDELEQKCVHELYESSSFLP